jgi:hypothetical protein
MTEPGVEQEGTISAGTRGQIVVGGAGTRAGFFTARAGRKTRPRARDRNWDTRADIYAHGRDIWQLEKIATSFTKLLEKEFCLFCQILKMATSFTKLLELRGNSNSIN